MQDEALFLTVVKLWAATAWADGVLADNERRLLEGLIRGAKVSEATRATALGFLATKVALEDAQVDRLAPAERSGVYRTSCRMATVDGQLADAEKAFLRRLASRLGLGGDAAASIEAEPARA